MEYNEVVKPCSSVAEEEEEAARVKPRQRHVGGG